MVCGQEKFPSRSCGQSASSGRPTEPTSTAGRSKPRGRSLVNELALHFRRRQAPISVLHRAISKPWAPFSATCRSCGLAHGQPRARSTTSCRFEASEPIPFQGANSIFSTCCGAISGRLRFCRQARSRRDSGDRNDSDQRRMIGRGRRCENKHRTITQLWQEIC